MRIVVITPIGPGHETASLECKASVQAAHKPYEVRHVLQPDFSGELGRSKARNILVRENPSDWYFFLDADDLLERDAFNLFNEALDKDASLEALFGAVCTDRNGIVEENVYDLTWEKLLRHGAAGTISMGCFVRGDAARQTPFNESMDAAEDFEFYLRLLKDRRWVKVKRPLVTIRRSVPSAVGPRGYTSLDWRGACQKVVDAVKVGGA